MAKKNIKYGEVVASTAPKPADPATSSKVAKPKITPVSDTKGPPQQRQAEPVGNGLSKASFTGGVGNREFGAKRGSREYDSPAGSRGNSAEFITDEDKVCRTKAIETYKSSGSKSSFINLKVEQVKLLKKMKDNDVGEQGVDKKKLSKSGIGGWFELYQGEYNKQKILIKKLRLFGSQEDQDRAVLDWHTNNELTSNFKHPNLASTLSTTCSPELIATIYEPTSTQTMYDAMKNKDLKWRDLSMQVIFEEVSSAMHYLHSHFERPHGFLSPQSVFFSYGHQVKLLHACEPTQWSSLQISNSHTRSFIYLSPRVLSGGKPCLQDDVYSFGMMLFSSSCQSYDAFTEFFEEISLEQLVQGVHENILASKLLKKIKTKKMKIDIKARTPPIIKNLILDCLKNDAAEITVTFKDIVKRLSDNRKELSAPFSVDGKHSTSPKRIKSAVLEVEDPDGGASAPAEMVVEEVGDLHTDSEVSL